LKRKKPAQPRWIILLAVLTFVVLGSAGLWLLLRPAPPGALTLAPVQFAALPGWTNADAGPALAAFRRSCDALLREPISHGMGGVGYAGKANDWRQVCGEAGSVPPSGAHAWFERRFAPFEVQAGAAREALFTGYYEPEIAASRTRQGSYTTPVYGLPRDLVTADLGLFRPELSGMRITGRIVGGKLVPLPVRAQIDSEGLDNAPVLLYARDSVAIFFLHIQGSGRASFEDGTVLRLAYAGQNGRPYTPVGRVLIQSGEIDREHMSMQAIRGWLEAHPGEAQRVMESDQSYVFFRELPLGDPELGSPGSEGVPLTPRTSIAVDPAMHPLGVPMFLTTQAPAPNPAQPPQSFTRLCITQDTGGAIKGGLRADIFWGYGAEAESIAGRMKSAGHIYVLLPKSLASRIPAKLLETS
jgi:membrane-bound lytic murein transglycosylase A